MCRFKSCIVFRNGDVFHHPGTDSHEDLKRFKGLKDNKQFLRNWVPAEYAPENIEDSDNIRKYHLIPDREAPDWWNEIKDIAEKKLKAIVSKVIIKKDTDIIISGDVVIAPGVTVKKLIMPRVIWCGKDSTIQDAGYSTIQNAWSSTIIKKNEAKILN